MQATIMILLAATSAWLWWRLTTANGENAELRTELAKLRRRLQARG
jgi:regulator of replication initiation timing